MSAVIILRPEPGNGRTAARAQTLGLTVRRCPLFEARALHWSPPDPARFDALLLTSARAARLAGPDLMQYRALPAYAVGAATAEALGYAGLRNIVYGAGDGSAIAARITAEGHRSVLHLAGEDVAPINAGPLHIERVPVYAMEEAAAGGLPDLLKPGVVLLVHSPAAGRRLAMLLPPESRAALYLVAISPAALAACGEGWAGSTAAAQPQDDAMLALALALCKTQAGHGRDFPDQ